MKHTPVDEYIRMIIYVVNFHIYDPTIKSLRRDANIKTLNL